MSEFEGFDLDRSTARAWSRFQARLADHIADMEDDDILVVEMESAAEPEEGTAPYVQFCAWGSDLVRAEVSSNEFLSDEHLLDVRSIDALVALGWSAPTASRDDDDPGSGSSNFFLDIERAQADRLAVMTTRSFRDVFGVTHPAFLSSDELDVVERAADPPSGPGGDGPAPDDEPLAVTPRDRTHLLELVDSALVPYLGRVPVHDEDDDIPIVAGSALVFVQVSEHMPAIQLFSVLVHGVTDHERAAFEVSVLNRDLRFVKFVLHGDSVMAYVDLPAHPFAPEHLRGMLAILSEIVDRVDDDLAVRVGGVRALEGADEVVDQVPEADELLAQWEAESDDAETDDELHPAMRTLFELGAGSQGELTPELAASVCEMDRDLILELISWNSAHEAAWRDQRDDARLHGHDDEAAACDVESLRAEAMVNLLRRSLRHLAEQQLERHRQEFGYSTGRRPLPPKRPRDDTLPGFETPEEDQPLWGQP